MGHCCESSANDKQVTFNTPGPRTIEPLNVLAKLGPSSLKPVAMLPSQPIRTKPDIFESHFDDVYSNYRQQAAQGVLNQDQVINYLQELIELQRRHDDGELGPSEVQQHEAAMVGLDIQNYEEEKRSC